MYNYPGGRTKRQIKEVKLLKFACFLIIKKEIENEID